MDTVVADNIPEGYIYNEALGIIEKAAVGKAVAANPNANTIELYHEVTYGIVGHAIVPDAAGNKFMGVLKAQYDPPNANHRYVDLYKALPGSDLYVEVQGGRVEPKFKGDIVDMMVVGADLWVGVTDHYPKEAPRDSTVNGKWFYGICEEGATHTHPEYALVVHAHPEYAPKPQPRGGVCGPLNIPYFRPNNTLTRGQACKIVLETFKALFPNAPYPAYDPLRQYFEDIPTSGPGSTYHEYTAVLAQLGAIGGYACDPQPPPPRP